jgi:hypothetical protein
MLEPFGVRVVSYATCELESVKCGRRWTPKPGTNGNLPRYYWRCPQGCNAG